MNRQILGILKAMQGNILRRPALLLEDGIHFEDALGRVRKLPYQYFRNWRVSTLHRTSRSWIPEIDNLATRQVFEAMLRVDFQTSQENHM
jgi:hypothetical protein